MTDELQQTDELDQVDEQTYITELSIAPDGRVYVFGVSRQILEVLESIGPTDEHLQRLIKLVVARASCPCPSSTATGETPVLQQIGDAHR